MHTLHTLLTYLLPYFIHTYHAYLLPYITSLPKNIHSYFLTSYVLTYIHTYFLTYLHTYIRYMHSLHTHLLPYIRIYICLLTTIHTYFHIYVLLFTFFYVKTIREYPFSKKKRACIYCIHTDLAYILTRVYYIHTY